MAKIFISYSRKNSDQLKRLVAEISETFGADGIFYDTHNAGGKPWWDNILEQIAASSVFIYLISNESLASYACRAEYLEAMRLGKHIVLVDVADTIDLRYTDPPIQFLLTKLHRLKNTQTGAIIRAITEGLSGSNAIYYQRPIQDIGVDGDVSGQNVNIGGTQHHTYNINYVINSTEPIREPSAGMAPKVEQVTVARGSWWDKLTEGQGTVIAAVVGAVAVIVAALIALYGAILPLLDDNETPTVPVTTVVQAVTTEPVAPTEKPIDPVDATITQRLQETTEANIVTQAYLAPTQTYIAEIVAMTDAAETQHAIATQTTLTPAPTNTQQPTFTLPATNAPDPLTAALELAEAGVSSNDEWTPYVQEFDGVEMVLVPRGCFTIGASPEYDDEQNGNEICFDEPFWIDKYEVTQADFIRRGATNNSHFSGNNLPVENITWFEAQSFCGLRTTRLPTEAEWEYAARGPDEVIYPLGNEWNANNAIWNRGASEGTANVGTIPAGASWVGAMDMSGNVWEWVSSLYLNYPYESNHENTANNTDARVLLGGSWNNNNTTNLRPANRNGNFPNAQINSLGFRCARDFEG